MQTRHHVALLTAGLLIGAQIGIASNGNPIADTSDQMEPVSSEIEALESGTNGEPAEAQGELATAPDEATQAPAAASEPNVPEMITPQTVVLSAAVPRSGDELEMLPAHIEYLARTEHLRLTGASGPVFPASANELPMLPAMAEYLDRREATRLAAEKREQAADVAAANDESLTPASQTEPATPVQQEPVREVSFLDRILPQRLRSLF